jgi:peptidoglycan hydrolase-like protein with peptidoglycan-binding domain
VTAAAPVVILPPVISLNTITSLATSSATITWTTDTNSDSLVDYGTTSSYGSSSSFDSTLGLTHSVNLTGLSPNTLYHYRVKSRDASNNLTTSSDATFMTNALPVVVVADTTPPVISNISASTVSAVAETIVWTTNELATSTIRWSTTTSYSLAQLVPETAGLTHTGALIGLLPSTTYNYCIDATDIAGNIAHSCGTTFTTAAAPMEQEMNPPVVSLIIVSNVSTSSAVIGWTTDELADGRIEYGTAAGYGSTSGYDTDYTLTDEATLSGLTPDTFYHYRVRTADTEGNETFSADNTFSTDALPQIVIAPPADSTPPLITDIVESSVGSDNAAIAWNTNELSTSTLEYGTTTSYGSSGTVSVSALRAHDGTLTGLTPGTTYYYCIHAVDLSRNNASSCGHSFSTTNPPVIADSAAPTISSITVLSITASSVSILWTNGELVYSHVEYGLTTNYGSQTPDPLSSSLEGSASISGLTASTTYHFRVRARDPELNVGYSGDQTFTTDSISSVASLPVISSVIAASLNASSATITWDTDVPSDSQVMYGVNSDLGATTTLAATLVTSHSVTISGLAENTNYRYEVASKPAGALSAAVSDLQEFSTLAASIHSSVAANITNVSAVPSTTSASVTWTTDKAATSQVEYGITTGYDQETALDSASVTSHAMPLSNLTSGTTYHYHLISVDADANVTTSQDYTFTTDSVPGISVPSAPIQIASVAVSSHGATSAILSWNISSDSDIAQTYDVRYSTTPIVSGTFGTANAAQSTAITYGDLSPNGTARSYVVTGLTAGTTYYFAVKAKYQNSEWSLISNVPSTTLDAAVSAPVNSGSSGDGGGGIFRSGSGVIAAPAAIDAVDNNAQVIFTWQNPSASTFARTIIVHKEGSYPSGLTDGKIIYEGRGENFTDIEATNGQTEYYLFYALDTTGNYSAPAKIAIGGNERESQQVSFGKAPLRRMTAYSFPDAIQTGDTGIEVQHLQQLLVEHPNLYPKKLVTGYFGNYTEAAVEKFQAQQGLPQTGVVDEITANKLNGLDLPALDISLGQLTSTFSKNLQYGDFNNDVEALQRFLIQQGFYPEAIISEYFGPLTRAAVVRFQQKYGITPGRGYVGSKTRAQIKAVLGL